MTVSCHVVITNGNATSFDFEEVLRLATTYCYRVVKVFPQFYFHVEPSGVCSYRFRPSERCDRRLSKKLVAVAHRLDDLATDVRP